MENIVKAELEAFYSRRDMQSVECLAIVCGKLLANDKGPSVEDTPAPSCYYGSIPYNYYSLTKNVTNIHMYLRLSKLLGHCSADIRL